MAPARVILMSCGSYNPPTNMHLRMFEIARDHLHRMGTHVVVGGVMSPVHDAYAKKELAAATHRCAMLRLALQNSDWIRLSTWETRQNGWTKTRISLQHHQNLLNSVLLDVDEVKNNVNIEDLEWIPENVINGPDRTPIQIKLLCGADLLESFGKRGLWAEEDIETIVGQHGLVVITREGCNPNKFIYDSDILSKHMHNIHIVTEWIPNEVSSTRIRRALKRGESVRYLLQDAVIEYIYRHGIYDAKSTTTEIKLELTSPNANDYLTIDPKYQSTFLTPSPSDVTMESPSPLEIISIDVPDNVLRKNLQNSTSAAFVAARSAALEDTRDKFFNVITSDNDNGKHLQTANTKAAYPGQAKQIIATETGESQILDEVGFVDDDKKVARVQSCSGDVCEQVETASDETNKLTFEKRVLQVESNEKESKSRVSCVKDNVKSEVMENSTLSDVSCLSKEDFACRDKLLVEETKEKNEEEHRDQCLNVEEIASAEKHSQSIRAVSPKDELPSYKNEKEIDIIENSVQYSVTRQFLDAPKDENSDNVAVDSKENRLDDTSKVAISSELNIIDDTVKSLTSFSSDNAEREENTGSSVDSYKDTKDFEEVDLSKRTSKRDSNLEIDGKYLKSVVNSRKSPRKLKDNQTRRSTVDTESEHTMDRDTYPEKTVEQLEKAEKRTKVKLSNTKKVNTEDVGIEAKFRDEEKYNSSLKGSLDSMMKATESKNSAHKKTKSFSKDAFSKKSKSYESIRRIQEVFLGESSKTDSTSQLITAEEFHARTDEFCSICCYMNEVTLRTEEEISSPNQDDVFYTLRSNCSSLGDEDPTECDICSSWNLQGSTEVLNRTILGGVTNNEDPFCEVCEICGEIGATFEPRDEVSVSSGRRTRRSNDSRSASRKSYKMMDGSVVTDVSLEDDSFEIENCGLMSGTESTEERVFLPNEVDLLDDSVKKEAFKSVYSRSSPSTKEKSRERYFVPKDEIAILSSGSRRLSRKGSLLKKKMDESMANAQEKRRYSSVDNLQLAKIFGTNEKMAKSKSGKLMASADNLRSNKNSRRCKSLQRSADNVRYLDSSSTDNLDSLLESLGQEENDEKPTNGAEKPKVRDNETVKMILTKHGIKIISERETAL